MQPKPLNNVNSHICQICGDDVGITTEGELFVACNECGFPVCRPCYEYERHEGNQSCPQCRTRYERHKGGICCVIWQLRLDRYYIVILPHLNDLSLLH